MVVWWCSALPVGKIVYGSSGRCDGCQGCYVRHGNVGTSINSASGVLVVLWEVALVVMSLIIEKSDKVGLKRYEEKIE